MDCRSIFWSINPAPGACSIPKIISFAHIPCLVEPYSTKSWPETFTSFHLFNEWLCIYMRYACVFYFVYGCVFTYSVTIYFVLPMVVNWQNTLLLLLLLFADCMTYYISCEWVGVHHSPVHALTSNYYYY